MTTRGSRIVPGYNFAFLERLLARTYGARSKHGVDPLVEWFQICSGRAGIIVFGLRGFTLGGCFTRERSRFRGHLNQTGEDGRRIERNGIMENKMGTTML